MARIAGVDLPREKRIEIGLTYIYGIGKATATEILAKAGVSYRTEDAPAGTLAQVRVGEIVVESFRGELDTLQEDLAAAEPCEPDPEEAVDHPGSDFFRLWIGPDRVEAWHGALNQARLALEARFAFGNERECATRYQSWPLDKREAFGRARVYGAIQQGLLSCLEGQFGG